MRRNSMVSVLTCLAPLCLAGSALAQAPAQPAAERQGAGRSGRPPLFFSEEWKQSPAGGEHPANPAETVANSKLELKLYGPGGKDIQVTGSEKTESNPVHLWTGNCAENCAAALRDKENFVDLTGLAMIRWVTKVSGFHQVHPIVKLADGTWLVGDHADGSTIDWHTNEFSLADVRWRKLNIAKVVTSGDWVNNPDLSKVDEVGFTDLMVGSGHGPGGWSDVGKIEIYGKPVKR